MISLSKLSREMNWKPVQSRKGVQLRLFCFLADLSKDSSMACLCTAWGQMTWICIFLFLNWFVPSTRPAFIMRYSEHFYDVLWFCIGNFGNRKEKKNTYRKISCHGDISCLSLNTTVYQLFSSRFLHHCNGNTSYSLKMAWLWPMGTILYYVTDK